MGHWKHSGSSFMCAAFAALSLTLSTIVYPSVFLRILGCVSTIGQQMKTHELDHQGLAIGIKKSLQQNTKPVLLKVSPFETLGYEFACKDIQRWPIIWVQFTYLRPGYMIVQYGDVLIVNAHFATGVVNKTRMQQVI